MKISEKLKAYIEKESFYKAVVEDGSDIIFIVDYNGIILYHNPAVLFVLGYPTNSLVGESFYNYIHPEILADFRTKFKECTEFPYSKNIEFQFRKTDQNYQYLEFNAINLKHKEGFKGVIMDCRDITQLKEDAEELRRAKQAKEQFLANMSHEIRTPINGISGMVSLLSGSETSPDQKKYLSAIKHSVDNLKVIINDILDLSALESGKLRFESIGFKVETLLSQVIETFIPQAEEKEIELSYEIDEKAKRVLLGDPVRLSQILMNLINNAAKFTFAGEILVKAEMLHLDAQIAEIQFSVKDTGIGIPDDKLETIFDTFSQADESVTRKFGGTGLGLAIVKQLVELQNGRLSLISKENVGSTFTFVIPYELGTTQDLILESEREKYEVQKEQSLPGLRVLLVEDNDINRLYADNLMRKWKVEVDKAENGLIAVERLRKNDYDLILMDLQMPVMDGFEATKSIRSSFSDPKSATPIVALTANAIAGDNERCFEVGMNDYLTKPFVPLELFTLLKRFYPEEKTSVKGLKGEMVAKDHANHSDDSPLIDLSFLKSVSNNDPRFIREMVQTFIDSTPESITRMETALKDGDIAQVGAIAHKIKPSITFMGINSLKEKIKVVEGLAKAGADDDQFREKANNLMAKLRQAIDELHQIRELQDS